MTGIERLFEVVRELGRFSFCYDLYEALGSIADQIERERECERDTIENLRLELGEARDDAAWVREHGGLDSVKRLLDWVVGHCSTKQQLDFDFWLSGRVMHELGFDGDMADRDEVEHRLLARLMPEGCEWEFLKLHMSNLRGFMLDVMDRLGVDKTDSDAPEIAFDVLDRRLMPEGMEWLVDAWPRFEDGAPLKLLDDFERYGEENGVSVVTMYADGSFALNFRAYSKGERVNRPAPKALDADGVEVEVGDDLYSVEGSLRFHVSAIDRKSGRIATEAMFALDKWADPKMYTHRAPVLAADGKPLREGETVYELDDDRPYTLKRFDGDHVYINAGGSSLDIWTFPNKLTHERPVVDTWERIEADCEMKSDDYARERMGMDLSIPAEKSRRVDMMRDLVRRAKSLAERERGE